MKNGRRNTFNWEADKRLGDPSAVSDPACWITGPLAEALKSQLPARVQMLRHAPRYQDERVFDISDDVQLGADGKLYNK